MLLTKRDTVQTLPPVFCSNAFLGSGGMPAYQSVPELALSEKYHLKAVGCEKFAEHASDQTTEQEWQELAAQWHSMADQAVKMLAASQHEFY